MRQTIRYTYYQNAIEFIETLLREKKMFDVSYFENGIYHTDTVYVIQYFDEILGESKDE